MHLVASALYGFAADPAGVVKGDIAPFIKILSLISLVLCTLYLIFGGFRYMTSAGDPSSLMHAKKIIKNSLIGLVIVLSAATLSGLLSNAYGSPSSTAVNKQVPTISQITPESKSSGIIDIIIKTITGVLDNIVQTVASPFLKGLSYFTTGTPLIEANSSAFNLWLIVTGIADGLFTLVIVLLGLHVMSFSTLGLDEVNLTQLLPRIGLAYLLINSSIFIIDAVISLSNMMIQVISHGQSVSAVWQSLTTVVQHSSSYGLATLIIMVIFLVFSVILIVYYVGRLVTLYLGGVLAPLIVLVWILPGFRDFALTATKKYFTLVFVLFVHVVILELAASIIVGVVNGSTNSSPLMALIVGLATLICLLKTQGVMSQLSIAAIGPKTARQIGQRLILNLNYLSRETSSLIAPLMPAFINSKSGSAPTKFASIDNRKTINPAKTSESTKAKKS
jgi:hypothetical protein